MKNISIAVVAAMMVSACGGSGGSGSSGDDAEFDALIDTARNTFDAVDTIEDNFQTPNFGAVANETGTVTYQGVAVFAEASISNDIASYLAIGDFSATADFSGAQSVTGLANGFFEVSNPEIVGDDSADFSDAATSGTVNGSFEFDLDVADDGFGFAVVEGTVSGSLTARDGTQFNLNNAVAEGEFIGDNLDAISVNGGNISNGSATIVSGTGLR